MTHYYTNNNDLDSKRRIIDVEILNTKLSFISDNGVFSKDKIDFGTALLLEYFYLAPSAKRGIDVGCGYGIIGITLSRVYNLAMTLVDVNDRALLLAQENAIRNKVQVEVMRSDALNELLDQRVDVVITNPPIRAGKAVVFQIYEQAATVLNDDGELWIVIQKKQGAASTISKVETLFHEVTIVGKKKGYIILKAAKPMR